MPQTGPNGSGSLAGSVSTQPIVPEMQQFCCSETCNSCRAAVVSQRQRLTLVSASYAPAPAKGERHKEESRRVQCFEAICFRHRRKRREDKYEPLGTGNRHRLTRSPQGRPDYRCTRRCLRAGLRRVGPFVLSSWDRPRKPEPREHRVFEASQRTYLTAGKCEHEKANPVAHAVGTKDIRPERRLTVGSRGHQLELPA
jgi:hypothetical protein